MNPDPTPLAQSPIAIIGMAGRFPDAADLDQFWKNLADGKESLREFSDAELLQSGIPASLLADPNYVKRGTVLDGVERFDASFFGFTPREAEAIDPQQRLFLEVAWEALEDAGHGGDSTSQTIGVFAGAAMNTYVYANLLRNPATLAAIGPYQAMLASDKDFLATRASYKLNLRGPSVTVQTACSTSLVAVQVACEALLAGRCDIALAGGVCLPFPDKAGYLYADGMILSKDGHCRPFDAAASGTRGSAGAGLVVLRRLDDALAAGDMIRAVIRGAAVNNDGSRKMGYTAPSVEGQSEAIRAALDAARVQPETISYIETHGTGTRVGDPIEIAGLTRVFRERTDRLQFCAIGSLKSNIGHLDAAAGVGGLIKTVLALQHEALPPSLNYTAPNPQIDFANSPFFVNDRLRPWTRGESPRRAGVSSFGIGGTNAHVVVEEAPVRLHSNSTDGPDRDHHLLVVSARTASALSRASERLAERFEKDPDISLANTAYTLQTGRRHFGHRRAVVAATVRDAVQQLRQQADISTVSTMAVSGTQQVAFMFSGQGSQYPGMARDVFESEPLFRAELTRCAELLKDAEGWDLHDLLYGEDSASPTTLLEQTQYAQPALFAIEYALARLVMSWGIRPSAMIGHSLGEYTAACISGVFSLRDALTLVAERGRLMQSMPAGAMLAVNMSADRVVRTKAAVSIAAVNAPGMCTVSGTFDEITSFEKLLLAQQIGCRRLRTSHAFHSEMMQSVLEPFRQRVAEVKLHPPEIPFLSNLTGRWITRHQAMSLEYWADHLRNPVLFAVGLDELRGECWPVLMEIGPGQTLTNFARQTAGSGAVVVNSLPHPQSSQPASACLKNALGRVWSAGVDLDWKSFNRVRRGLQRVPLPTYPFERQRCWVDPLPIEAMDRSRQKSADVADWFYTPSWKRVLLPSERPDVRREPRHWILLGVDFANPQLVTALQDEAAKLGDQVSIVRGATEFERTGAKAISLDASNPEHYTRLVRAVAGESVARPAFVDLSNTGAESSDESAFTHPLLLAQALLAESGLEAADFLLLSSGMHRVLREDSVNPTRWLLTGATRIVPLENPAIRTRSIDLPVQIDSASARKLASELLAEVDVSRECRCVAYRDGQCWEETWEPIHLTENAATAGALKLKDGGAYWITGGLGGLGLALARFLASTCRARLMLTSRSGLPPRDTWDHALAAGRADSQLRSQIQAVRELENLGAQVWVEAADVADPIGMKRVTERIRLEIGALHGVIHAAGVIDRDSLPRKCTASTDSVLRPKVTGSRVLCEAVRELEPEFIILCSSISAIAGAAGLIDYSAANAFLDGWAVAATDGRFGRTRIVSVNWDSWRDVGMALSAPGADGTGGPNDALALAIRPAEGVEAFRRVLKAGLPRIAVVTRSLPLMLSDISRSVEQAATAIAAIGDRPAINSVRENISPASSDGANVPASAAVIAAIWRELLGVQVGSLDEDFFALGGHSLAAIGVLARIRRSFGISLDLRAIFDSPTIRQLAQRVDSIRLASSDAPAGEDENREVIEL